MRMQSILLPDGIDPEAVEVLTEFVKLLIPPTGDGGNKRLTQGKPLWKVDPDHEPGLFSHLNEWKHGVKKDKDSGSHPLAHLAWRALAIAWQEMYCPKVNPVCGLPGCTIQHTGAVLDDWNL